MTTLHFGNHIFYSEKNQAIHKMHHFAYPSFLQALKKLIGMCKVSVPLRPGEKKKIQKLKFCSLYSLNVFFNVLTLT